MGYLSEDWFWLNLLVNSLRIVEIISRMDNIWSIVPVHGILWNRFFRSWWMVWNYLEWIFKKLILDIFIAVRNWNEKYCMNVACCIKLLMFSKLIHKESGGSIGFRNLDELFLCTDRISLILYIEFN